MLHVRLIFLIHGHATTSSKEGTGKEHRGVQFGVLCTLLTASLMVVSGFRIVVGDDECDKACWQTKQFDTEFISSFVQLLAHDAHLKQPAFYPGDNSVNVITCPFPEQSIQEEQVEQHEDHE